MGSLGKPDTFGPFLNGFDAEKRPNLREKSNKHSGIKRENRKNDKEQSLSSVYVKYAENNKTLQPAWFFKKPLLYKF